MNVVDFFFEKSGFLDKDLILNPKDRISFNMLRENVRKLAGYINDEIGRSKNILLASENSKFFVTAYLAIMKSGNVCVPLNPLVEKENLDYITDKTDSNYLFISDRLKKKFDFKGSFIWNESDINNLLRGLSSETKWNFEKTNDKQPAQILFTSGSTGQPKGVMLSHRNLIANTTSIIEYLNLTSSDIMEVVLPFYYCYGLSLLHTHLRVGGSIVLNNQFIFLGSVINDLKKYRCTGFAGVPSHFQILLRKTESFKTTDFPDLRYVTQAGGKLYDAFIQEFVGAFPDKKFYVMYGQTEATARLSYLPPDLVLTKIGSIGKGIPGVVIDVFNETNERTKAGETGEIVAKGDNIMLGYLNDPEATRKTLDNGWLRTGDLAVKDEEGFIYLVARKREIIKVGGRRISPKEVEEAIVSIPEVVDCTVTSCYDELLGEAIKATVVLKNGISEEVAKTKILRKCKTNLSKFKLPQVFEFRNNLEVNAAGKKVLKN